MGGATNTKKVVIKLTPANIRRKALNGHRNQIWFLVSGCLIPYARHASHLGNRVRQSTQEVCLKTVLGQEYLIVQNTIRDTTNTVFVYVYADDWE